MKTIIRKGFLALFALAAIGLFGAAHADETRQTKVIAPGAIATPNSSLKMSTIDNSWRNDPRIKSYENEVHQNANHLRERVGELAAWQKRNWLAPRVCSGSKISWANKPASSAPTLYDCAPFQCQGDGLCRQECSSDSNCAPGAQCLDVDSSGHNGVCVLQ